MNATALNRRTFLETLAAGLGAAAVSRAGEAPRRIAVFACDVTPPLGTPIYSSHKPLEVIEHPLLAKGILLEDEGGRSVLCAVDWCELCNGVYDLYRRRIAEAAGTTPDRVAVQTVHQHTAPLADSDAMRLLEEVEQPPVVPSIASFEKPATAIAAAVREAAGRLQPYDRIGTSQARVERVASNRRVFMGDGKVGFRASSCKDPELIAKPEGLIDPFLKTVTFAQGETPIARLHYYATHPQSFYGDPRASYDFVGMARERLEKEEGVFQVYFTGCSGDIACGKYNDASKEARQGLYERLYDAMKASAVATKYGPAEEAHWRSAPLRLEPRSDARYNVKDAGAVMRDTNKPPLERVYAAMFLSWVNRIKTPIDLTMMRLGDIVFVHLPGEPMIEFQLYAQELLPDAFVAVAGYGDCGTAYICPDRVYEEGGYEATASHSAPGAEAIFRNAIEVLMKG